MNPNSLQSRYCARHGINPAEFRAKLLARSLYPHARLLAPLLRLLDRQYFQADYEFVDDVAYLEDIERFHDALDSFVGHFSNRGFLRYSLKMRISARRMWRIARENLPGTPSARLEAEVEGSHSITPFSKDSSKPKPDDS